MRASGRGGNAMKAAIVTRFGSRWSIEIWTVPKPAPAAGEVLVRIGAPAVEPLCVALRDESPSVRREAARALARSTDERALAPLCRALTDADPRVRLRAAGALGRLARREALLALRARLRPLIGEPDGDVLRAIHDDDVLGHLRAVRLHQQRVIFTFHYLFELRRDDDRLEAARDVFVRGKEFGCDVVAYIPPLDVEGGRELLGDGFEREIADKVETVLAALAPFSVHDWSTLLPSEYFFHRFEPTEHLNERGRARVADEIARAVDSAITSGGSPS